MTIAVRAEPAAAHGIDGPRNLPLPRWLFALGAALAVALSYVIVELVWRKPRLRGSPPRVILGRRATAWLRWPLVALGCYLIAAVLAAGWFGPLSLNYNVAPRAVLVLLWVVLPLVSILIGNLWSALNPLRLLPLRTQAQVIPAWCAPVVVSSLAWLELAHPDPSQPRVVAVWASAYGLLSTGCTLRFGRRWLSEGDGFTVLFSSLSSLAPLTVTARGELAIRAPLSAARLAQRPQVVGVSMVVLGAATFDGLSQLDRWTRLVGNSSTAYAVLSSIGLLVCTAAVAALYLLACARVARRVQATARATALVFAPSLLPIAAGYTLAHYWSLLVFDGQIGFGQLSDPFGRGWNVLGTRGWQFIDFQILRSTASAYIQVAALVLGHVVAVVVAHDLALQRWPERTKASFERPMIAVMIAFTVIGLMLLLGD